MDMFLRFVLGFLESHKEIQSAGTENQEVEINGNNEFYRLGIMINLTFMMR